MSRLRNEGTSWPYAGRVTRLGLPFMLGGISSTISGVIDAAMIGRFGSRELAAVAAGSAIFDIPGNVVLGACLGHQILSARFAGRDDPGRMRDSLVASVRFSGGIALVLMAAMTFAGEAFIRLVTSDPVIANLGAGYLVARSPSLLLVVAFTLLAAMLNSYERPRYAVIAGILIGAFNILLDIILIYGVGPIPSLGAVGNGLSTTGSWLIGTAVMFEFARRFGLFETLRRPRTEPALDFETSVGKLSWPGIASTLVDSGVLAIFFASIATAGQAALGGARVAYEVMVLVFATAAAFGAAVRILIGRALGAASPHEALSVFKAGRFTLIVPGLMLAGGLFAARQLVARLFSTDSEVLDAAIAGLGLVAVSVPLIAWSISNDSVLRATGRTRWDLYSNIGPVLLLQLPVSWYLVIVAGKGVAGAFLGVLAYWVGRSLFSAVMARFALRAEGVPVGGFWPTSDPGGEVA